jgi:16S rRNA (cytosine967-C5)-methyltransferase
MHGPALWQQLQSCAVVIERVLKGASATQVLEGVRPELRPGVQALSYFVMRHLGTALALRQRLAPKAPKPAVDALLLTALALLQVDANEAQRYDPHTLVNQAVEAAKKQRSTQALASFINGCLRRFLREQSTLMHEALQTPQARWNHPAWWITRLQKEQVNWETILQANNQQAPMVLRVNRRHISRDDYLAELEQVGIEAWPQGEFGVMLLKPKPVQDIPGFAQGVVSVQDTAAQLAAPLLLGGLNLGPDARVLDACAAPGGKTAHLLELCDAQVKALEIDAQRAEKITHTLERLNLQAQVVTADAAQPDTWWDGVLFDAMLVDAPCTASGIVKRHPDVRWLRRESDIAQLATQQARLLQALWPLLKPRGRLLYCTCSVFRAEGQDQIDAFLTHNTQARLLPSPGHLMPVLAASTPKLTDNPQDVHDGFYYALLEKVGA